MRNQYPGTCYRCGGHVPAGEGHFEKVRKTKNTWLVQHAGCAIEHRGDNTGRREAGDKAIAKQFGITEIL